MSKKEEHFNLSFFVLCIIAIIPYILILLEKSKK